MRLVLQGLRFEDFDAEALWGRLSSFAWHLEVEDRSIGISPDDIAALEEQPTVKGLFVRRLRERIAEAARQGNAEEQERLQRALLRGLTAFETVARGRPA